MSVIKFNRNFSTLFSWDTDENPTTEQDYQNAVKNWTETEMNIVDTLLWQPTTEYATGNIVKTPSLPSQYVLRCAEAGTSGSTEPSYSGAGAGDTVADGSVEWVIVSLATGNAADVDASNIGVNAEVDNSEAWASAIGGGAIAEDDGRLVTGDTVYAVTSVMETNIATNTEAIEENAENIATNTGNIAQNTTDIDIADKRISNIEKLLQGNLYDYQTDTDSKYTKSVPSGAMPYASLDSVGGKTVVWNQLVTNGNFNDSTGWTFSNGTGAISDNVATVTCGSSGSATTAQTLISFTSGHKYYLACDIQSDTANDFWLSVAGSKTTANSYKYTITTLDTWNHVAGIITPDVSLNVYYIMATRRTSSVFKVRKAKVIDLTLMYGSGNEPSTADEVESVFPADVYSYNAGTLLSAGVTEVVSKKADTTTIATYSIPAEIQALEGYGWSAGTAYNYVDYERKVFVQNVGKVEFDGTETWTIGGTSPDIYARISSPADSAPNQPISIPAVCDRLTMDTTNSFSDFKATPMNFRFNGSAISATPYISITNKNCTTATDFRSFMNGAVFYYELATPIETDISAYLTNDNLIEVEAGGTLTFPNSNGDDYQIPVPSSETYMVDLQASL